MTDFGRRSGVGDMLKSVYDPDLDGVIATAQTQADMTKAVYDTDDDGKVDAIDEHASSHQDGGSDEIDATGLTGKTKYVQRGDPANLDKSTGNFTTDGNWNDLDLSAIVPAGATQIHLNVFIEDENVNSYLRFREKGNSNARNVLETRTIVADLRHHLDGLVSCDANRVIQYQATNTTFTNIGLVVRGWLITP